MGNSLSDLQRLALHDIETKIREPVISLQDEEKLRGLTTIPAMTLKEKILSGEVTLSQVLDVFHLRRQKENNDFRLVTDVLYTRSQEKAKELQKKVDAGEGKDLPLLGFVMSVKDSILMQGFKSTCGMVANYPHIYDKPTPLLDYLESQGALIVSRSNLPQLLYSLESLNHIFGEARNPLDESRTPGGSSGGDSGQLALGLVNVGLGSDGAGSLRIPALFCGLTTVKVTASRFDQSLLNTLLETHPDMPSVRDFSSTPTTIGPICRSVADLEVFLRVYNDFNRIDRTLPPLPWRQPEFRKRVASIAPFALFELSDATSRAQKTAESALISQGFEIVPLDFADFIEELISLCLSLLMKNTILSDVLLRKHHMKEPILNVYNELALVFSIPSAILKVAKGKYSLREQFMISALIQAREVNNNVLLRKLADFKAKIIKIFESNGVDLALCPGLPPAVPRGSSGELTLSVIYMFIWNILDFPSGAITTTTVNEDEQHYSSKHQDKFTRRMEEVMKNSAGLPVGVQVVGPPFAEENIVELLKIIEANVQFKLPKTKLD